jgi:flavin reductase (DIM6/NTAB) family NADH-FMN oxidoreductase RutF
VAALCVKAPLINECYANLEYKVVDEKMVAKYNFFFPKALKAWDDPAMKDLCSIHHRGKGVFMVAGETIKLPSEMKQLPLQPRILSTKGNIYFHLKQ